MNKYAMVLKYLKKRAGLTKKADPRFKGVHDPRYVAGVFDPAIHNNDSRANSVHFDSPEGKLISSYADTGDEKKLNYIYDMLRYFQNNDTKAYRQHKSRLLPMLNAAKKRTTAYGGYSKEQAQNLLAKTLFYETRGEDSEGRHHVGTVINNRASGTPELIPSVIFRPWQFSVWNGSTVKHPERLKTGFLSPGRYKASIPDVVKSEIDNEEWNDSVELARQIFGGAFDTDGDYNAYYNPNKASPTWGDELVNPTDVGSHRFGYLASEDPTKKKKKK